MTLALDRASVRSYDKDGRLHVATTNISKAAVNGYLGREIPDYQELGLDPDRIYQLLRDPEELARGASTFNNLPLLSRHTPVSADSHEPDLVIGSTGTDAEFVAPYLKNSLVVWARDAIEGVEDESQEEISCGYRYRADMTPGTYEGQPYDGVMRDLIGNHVALVTKGRAGPDVVVQDSALPPSEGIAFDFTPFIDERNCQMATKLSRKAILAQGAITTFLAPKLAQDASIDLIPALTGVTGKNFADKKAGIATAITEATKDKLAKDASIDGLTQLLDQLEKIAVDEAPDKKPDSEADPDLADDEDDEGENDKKGEKEAVAGLDENDDDKKDKDMVSKGAMDSAISAAEKRATEAAIRTQREIRDAERAVRPYVGDLAMAHDSAEAVYRTALKSLGVAEAETIHASALPAILKMQPLPDAKTTKKPSMAQDAAGAKSYAERFPETTRIRHA